MKKAHGVGAVLVIIVLIVGRVGLGFWMDYSHRALERAVGSASQTKDVRVLIRALKSNHERLRRKAADAVASIGPEAKAAVPALIEALSKDDTSFTYATHRVIVRALGRIGPDAKDAVPKLSEMLDQRGAGPGDRGIRDEAVLDALARMGPKAEAAVPVLLERLKREDFPAKSRTIRTLGLVGTGSKDVAAALIEVLENEKNRFYRTAVYQALIELGPNAEDAVQGYVQGYIEKIFAEVGLVRLRETGVVVFFPVKARSRLTALGELGKPMLRAALNDEREPVRVICAEVLAEQGDTSSVVVDVLTAALEKPWYRGGAVAALGKVGPPARKSLPGLRNIADSRYNTILEEAIQAIEGDRTEAPSEEEREGKK